MKIVKTMSKLFALLREMQHGEKCGDVKRCLWRAGKREHSSKLCA